MPAATTKPQWWLSDGWSAGQGSTGRLPFIGKNKIAVGGNSRSTVCDPLDDEEPVCHSSFTRPTPSRAGPRPAANRSGMGNRRRSQSAGRLVFRRRHFRPSATICWAKRGSGRRVPTLPIRDMQQWPLAAVRRVQRQVHVQSDGVARRIMCDASVPFSAELPQFFPS